MSYDGVTSIHKVWCIGHQWEINVSWWLHCDQWRLRNAYFSSPCEWRYRACLI